MLYLILMKMFTEPDTTNSGGMVPGGLQLLG
jgi:hypothetical protein